MRNPGGSLISSSRGAAKALAAASAVLRKRKRSMARLSGSRVHPDEEPLGHFIAVRARERPQLAVVAAVHLGDEAYAAARHRGDERHAAVEDASHVSDKARREAFHLADLVHEIERHTRLRTERRIGGAVDGRDIDAVFPDAMRLRQLDVRDERFAAVVSDKAKAAALAARTYLGGVEAGDAHIREALGEAPDNRRLAGSRGRGQQQMNRGPSNFPVTNRPSARLFCYEKIALTPLLVPVRAAVLEALLEMAAAVQIALLEDPGVAALRVREHLPRFVVRVPEEEAVRAVAFARLGDLVQAPFLRLLLA